MASIALPSPGRTGPTRQGRRPVCPGNSCTAPRSKSRCAPRSRSSWLLHNQLRQTVPPPHPGNWRACVKSAPVAGRPLSNLTNSRTSSYSIPWKSRVPSILVTNFSLRSPMANLQLDPHKTALVLIDLQNAVVAVNTAPHPAAQVVANSVKLAEAFRAHDAPVVYVRVDLNDFLELPVDQPVNLGNAPLPGIVSEIAPSAGFQPGDILLTKRHWGAFAGTNLEQQLKSRGVDTVVLTGISTNAGVESTARQGTGLGFGFVVVEDACSGQDGEQHRFAFEKILPRLCRVRSTNEVLAALAAEQTPHKGRECGSTFTKKTQSDIQRERVQRNRFPRRKDKSRGEHLAEN